MASGLDIRAGIDTETVKGLLLLNGGGAVAFLAFLPAVIGREEYAALAIAILIGLLLCHLGLLFAVIHNRLRRVCNLRYEQVKADSPDHPVPCQIFGRTLSRQPCVCLVSITFMWGSMAMFFAAGLSVFVGGLLIVWRYL